MNQYGLVQGLRESIVEAGILAPSADNRHPVEFDFPESGIAVWGTEPYTNAPFHRRILSLIGLGAMAENMLLRAARLGFAGHLQWFPEPAKPALIAHIGLRQATCDPDDIESAIRDRHTNRKFFRGPRMNQAERQSLSTDATRIPGVQLRWFDERRPRRQILRLLRIAESERFRAQPLHAELFSSIRFDLGWRSAADEGLSPGALDIEAPLRAAFSSLRHWPVMRFANALGGGYLIGIRAAYAPCRFSPHVCALTTTLSLEEGALAVGRALERVWLRATKMGLAFQPFAAPALFALEGYKDVRSALRRQLAEGWSEVVPDGTPLLVFRLGRASSPQVRSGRPSIEHYFKKKAPQVRGLG